MAIEFEHQTLQYQRSAQCDCFLIGPILDMSGPQIQSTSAYHCEKYFASQIHVIKISLPRFLTS